MFGNDDCGERNGDNDVADMMVRMLVAMIILSMTTTLQSTEKNALWPSSRHVRSLDSQWNKKEAHISHTIFSSNIHTSSRFPNKHHVTLPCHLVILLIELRTTIYSEDSGFEGKESQNPSGGVEEDDNKEKGRKGRSEEEKKGGQDEGREGRILSTLMSYHLGISMEST